MSTPITILTGFLGSGKTTLLNHALRGPWLSRALVVVNELGDVPLDHLLVKELREDVLLLDSGCVCCSIRGDLVDALLAEAERDRPLRFDRVFVETTGLADPTPIVATLSRHAALSQHFHLDAVIAAVDAEHGFATFERHGEATKQVLLADDIILTKLDLVDEVSRERLRTMVTKLNPHARVFSAERGLLDWHPLLEWTPSTLSSRLDVREQEGLIHERGGHIRSFTVRADREVDFPTFAAWLSMVSQLHGHTLLRVKGLLRVAGDAGPVVVQAVQHVVYPTYSMPRWPSADESSRLVVITRGMSMALVELIQSTLRSLLGAITTNALR